MKLIETEEVGDELADSLLVVDECFKNLCATADGKDVVVGDDGRNETRSACGKQDTDLGRPEANVTVTLQVHNDDERVVLDHVTMERCRGLNDLDTEVRGVQELMGNIGVIAMTGLVFGIYGIVNSLCCQFGMKFTGLAVKSGTVVVENAVSDIRGLLDFGQTYATTDGMDPTGRQVEDIVFVNLMTGEDFSNSAISHSLTVFLWGNLLLESGIKAGSWFSIEDVPHLGLPELVVLTESHLVIGMYLDGEILMGIDNLGKQRQLVVVPFRNSIPKYFSRMVFYDFCELVTSPYTVDDH